METRTLPRCLFIFLFPLRSVSPSPLAVAQNKADSSSASPAAEASNMSLVGTNDLQGRGAYQPTIHKQGERWIAYIGEMGGSALNPLTDNVEDNGTSILNVTDPAHPKFLAHIPGEPATPGKAEAGGSQMARVCDGSTLPHEDKNKVYLLRPFGKVAPAEAIAALARAEASEVVAAAYGGASPLFGPD